MICRSLADDDVAAVRSLHERLKLGFYFPDKWVVSNVVTNDNGIIAAGFVRPTAEAILILDPDLSTRSKFEAISQILDLGIFQCQKLGIDELHAFLTGPCATDFARNLVDKFGFEICKGIPCTLRF